MLTYYTTSNSVFCWPGSSWALSVCHCYVSKIVCAHIKYSNYSLQSTQRCMKLFSHSAVWYKALNKPITTKSCLQMQQIVGSDNECVSYTYYCYSYCLLFMNTALFSIGCLTAICSFMCWYDLTSCIHMTTERRKQKQGNAWLLP